MAEAVRTLPLPGDEAAQRRRLPFWVDVFRRLIKEKPLGLIGLVIVIVFILLALIAPVIAPDDPGKLGTRRLASPDFTNFFGTDNLGRDVFSRVIIGARTSITFGFLSVALATVVSVTIGIISGYFGGWFDMITQRFVDAFLAFPALVFLIAVGAVFQGWNAPGLPEQGLFQTRNVILILSLGILFGVGQSRVIRSAVLSVKAQTFVEAARAIGVGNVRMLWSHILPNIMAPLITLATLSVGNAILASATLSFLGLGVPPDVPDWGQMLNTEARSFMTKAWWLAVFPGAALSLAVFGFNMLGDALRDLLDPRLRTGS